MRLCNRSAVRSRQLTLDFELGRSPAPVRLQPPDDATLPMPLPSEGINVLKFRKFLKTNDAEVRDSPR